MNAPTDRALILAGTLSWQGGPPRPVTVTLAHAPECPDADDRGHPVPHSAYAHGPLVVPPPPDYSTPRACSDRALERGTRDPWYLEVVRLGRSQGTYAPFRKAVEKAGGSMAFAADVRDTYTSKWVVVPPRWIGGVGMSGYTLALASEVAAPIPKSRKPATVAA